MSEQIINRAEILIAQQKYPEAERLLKDLLHSDPNDTYLLTLLAEVSLMLDKLGDAYQLINSAISIEPDNSHLFYIKARIEIQQDKYDDAEKNIELALQLDPNDADYYALWATIKLSRKQYDEALNLSNTALELDAENILALNTRSSALLKLDRHEDAFSTIEGALREDPNNAYTHANYGWNLLEKGDHKKALEHFKEALKSDPNFNYAQMGMIEALKATNVFYKLFLRYSFWINNLTAKYQWGVIIGFYLLVRVLNGIAKNNQTLKPYLTPIVILLALIAFSTWIIEPVSNLFLRFNVYGRHLLKKKEILSSNFVALSFLIFLSGVLCYFTLQQEKFLTVALFGFIMMVPCGMMFSDAKFKHAFLIYTSLMALIGMAGIAIAFTNGEVFNSLVMVFFLGFVAFQWVANYLLIKEGNR